jgi:redox-sensitive bicupin YhaK (pirin superfamily)
MAAQTVADKKIRYVVDSFVTLEGPGIPIRRAIPSRSVRLEDVDPMLLLDDFKADSMPASEEGFGEHPHRGFEIITYALQGGMFDRTRDGHVQQVKEGGLQKITAGSGMWHGAGPNPGHPDPLRGLQIWINLAKKDKKLAPEYQVVDPSEIPVVKKAGSVARVLVGKGSPTRLHTEALFLDVSLEPDSTFEWEIPAAFQGYAYVLEGKGKFGAEGKAADEGQIAVLGEGERLKVTTGKSPLRFLLAAGQPHREPVRWTGPYVD